MRLAVGTITLVTGLLVTLGLTMLHSVGMHHRAGMSYYNQQCVWLVVGFAACLVAASVDYRRTRWLAWGLPGVTAILLVIARVPPYGHLVNGAWRWIHVGGFTFQPSEFAKVALILGLAVYAQTFRRRMTEFVHGLVIPGAGASVILGLVFLGKDLGTTALLSILAASMLFGAGTRLRHLVPVGLVGFVLLCGFLRTDPVRWRRVEAFLHPELYGDSIALQSIQSTIAIGAGGTYGLGLGNGVQKAGFVPEQQTDFIFSVIGEELGLQFTLPLLAAYFAFTAAALTIARRAGDMYGSMIACGVGLVIGFQAVINIAVTTGSVPNKGLALPFVSYGGSCLVAMLTLVGLLINVAFRSPRESAGEFLPDSEDREASALQGV